MKRRETESFSYLTSFSFSPQWIIDSIGPNDNTTVLLFIQLLQEIPRIPREVIDLLKQLCDEADTRELGFHTLRHLVLTRPIDRP
jgi:hypothetical protein